MVENAALKTSRTPSVPAEPRSRRIAWQKPTLVCYGDLRQLTAGPTPGAGESGNPAVFRP